MPEVTALPPCSSVPLLAWCDRPRAAAAQTLACCRLSSATMQPQRWYFVIKSKHGACRCAVLWYGSGEGEGGNEDCDL